MAEGHAVDGARLSDVRRGEHVGRAEPLLLLVSGLAVLSLTVPPVASLLLIGVGMGVGVNLKVSAIIYLFPAFVLVWKKQGFGAVLAAAAVAAVVAALPYIAFPNISLAGYLSWVQAAAGQGVRLGALPTALEWMIVVMVPMLGMWRFEVARGASDVATFRVLVVAAMVISLPLAVKHGTGVYHFLPFVPSIMFAACAERSQGRTTIAPAMLATFVLIAALQVPPGCTRPRRSLHGRLSRSCGSMKPLTPAPWRWATARTIACRSFVRSLVFAGQPYALDGASLMDWHWSGRPFPPPALDALRACAVDAWIIPAGGPPFVLPNAYPISGSVLPDGFRTTFAERHTLETSGEWFDVWRCRR